MEFACVTFAFQEMVHALGSSLWALRNSLDLVFVWHSVPLHCMTRHSQVATCVTTSRVAPRSHSIDFYLSSSHTVFASVDSGLACRVGMSHYTRPERDFLASRNYDCPSPRQDCWNELIWFCFLLLPRARLWNERATIYFQFRIAVLEIGGLLDLKMHAIELRNMSWNCFTLVKVWEQLQLCNWMLCQSQSETRSVKPDWIGISIDGQHLTPV